MTTNSLILSDLKMCLDDNQVFFDLLNAYRGVQFLCVVVLTSVLEDNAVFQAIPSPCAMLLETGKRTFVLNAKLKNPLHATVASYDPASGKLELNDFTPAGANVGNRRELRVEPVSPVQIAITLEGKTIPGWLVDISMGGAGFTVDHFDFPVMQRGKAVTVKLHLPNGLVRLPGILVSFEKAAQGYRVAVEFTEDAPQKAILDRYIRQRQFEVRDEVQQRFEALFPPQKN